MRALALRLKAGDVSALSGAVLTTRPAADDQGKLTVRKPQRNRPEPVLARAAETMRNLMDRDRDAKLSPHEFKEALPEPAKPPATPKPSEPPASDEAPPAPQPDSEEAPPGRA